MSRRGRHGRHQNTGAPARPRPGAPATERPASAADGRPSTQVEGASARADAAAVAPEAPWTPVPVDRETGVVPAAPASTVPPTAAIPVTAPAPTARPEPEPGRAPRLEGGGEEPRTTCTVAQLRRFIKSRPWIPMHELRRRFGIYGGDDDVSPIRLGDHTLFIGLPLAEARLMAELLGGGDVGYELSLDPVTPIVVGVYPMRPVPRG